MARVTCARSQTRSSDSASSIDGSKAPQTWTRLQYVVRLICVREGLTRRNLKKLLFPGVGAFGPAMEGLRAKGYIEPLLKYIRSGKPYMGICIGMQVRRRSVHPM